MNGAVGSEKSKHVTEKPHEEGESVGRPVSTIDKGLEHLRWLCMRPKNNKGEQYSEEAEDVENQNQSLKFREQAADNRVDGDTEQDDSPEEHDAMPGVRLVGRIGKNDQALCHGPVEIPNRSAEGLPSEDGQPPCHLKSATEKDYRIL